MCWVLSCVMDLHPFGQSCGDLMEWVAQGWDVKRLYFGRHNKPDMDNEGVTLVKDLDEFLKQCDVVSINVPLSDKTK